MKIDDPRRLGRRLGHCRVLRDAAGLASFFGAALVLAVPASKAPVANSKAPMNRYVLDPKASLFTIRLGKSGLFAFAGHEPEIVVGAFAGTVTVDGGDIAGSSVDVTFEATGLRVTEKGLPKADVPKVQETMLGPRCLDAARFPTIHFASTKVAVPKRSAVGTDAETAAGTVFDLELSGTLTLRGVTRTVTFPVRSTIAHDSLKANGRATIRQTDLGSILSPSRGS